MLRNVLPSRVKVHDKNLAKPINSFTFRVAAQDLPARLDQFLAQCMPWRSRTFFQKMIDQGEVLLNGRPGRAGIRLREHDVIVVDIRAYQQEFVCPETIALDIIFEDDSILVLNKPAGIVVHPTGRHLYDTIMNAVHSRYSDAEYPPRLVHRLDKETSGVLVVAKSEAVRVALGQQIENRCVTKTYRALAHGVFSQRHGEIVLPLQASTYSHIRLKQDVVHETGLPAHSEFIVEASTPIVPGLVDGVSLVTVRLVTGRPHQIRVHLAAIGHPIIADKLYGRERTCVIGDTQVSTHLLHAWMFGCTHPTTGKAIEFTAPVPRVFDQCVTQLFG